MLCNLIINIICMGLSARNNTLTAQKFLTGMILDIMTLQRMADTGGASMATYHICFRWESGWDGMVCCICQQ